TVWYDAIQEEIDTHQPDIIVVNGGDNQFYEGGSLVMGKEDIYETYKAAAKAKIIVSHM
ncbi:MBL fold metallo-hydrolase, partial [Bacillus inaquosorum]|nr:MBL fold metallo-hydrolase [Bacillus inaquosorum]